MWYDNLASFLSESISSGSMTIETALERMAQFAVEYGKSTSSIDAWTGQVSRMNWGDGCSIRQLRKHGLATLACEGTLRNLKERYPVEIERHFDHLLAELTLRENRAVLRGEEVEI